MKAVRMFSATTALILFAVAIFPFATKPVAAQTSQPVVVASPVQAFMDATRGMPLLTSMDITAPFVSLSVESSFADYACKLVSQKPKNYTRMVSRQYFDMSWTIKNSGNHTWLVNTIPFKYISGTKMQTRGNEFIVNSTIGRGNNITLVVDMNAPKERGIYSTLWGLFAGKKPFCTVTLTISVSR